MIKKFFILAAFTMLAASAFAQSDSRYYDDYGDSSAQYCNYPLPRYVRKTSKFNHYFIGGGILGGGFSSNGWAFGINPTIGYSINRYVDVGIMLNAVYYYQNYDYYTDMGGKQHTWNLGAAPFARIFPIPYVFLDVSFEDNYVTTKYLPYGGGGYSDHWNVPSLIGAIGYYTRVYGQSFFFASIGMDFLTNVNSPYREQYYNRNGGVSSRALPIIRVGYGVNLW